MGQTPSDGWPPAYLAGGNRNALQTQTKDRKVFYRRKGQHIPAVLRAITEKRISKLRLQKLIQVYLKNCNHNPTNLMEYSY